MVLHFYVSKTDESGNEHVLFTPRIEFIRAIASDLTGVGPIAKVRIVLRLFTRFALC